MIKIQSLHSVYFGGPSQANYLELTTFEWLIHLVVISRKIIPIVRFFNASNWHNSIIADAFYSSFWSLVFLTITITTIIVTVLLSSFHCRSGATIITSTTNAASCHIKCFLKSWIRWLWLLFHLFFLFLRRIFGFLHKTWESGKFHFSDHFFFLLLFFH